MGLYVYAIEQAGDGAPPALEGILGQPVYRLTLGGLAATVSDCPLQFVRPERRHIAANQQVLSRLNREFDLLPMAFGTVAQSTDALSRFFDEHGEALTAQLRHIAGRVEMSLRVRLEVPDAIAHLVDCTPELKIARDRLFQRPRPPSHDERIRLGQLCAETLERYRAAHVAQTLATLGPSCADIRTLPVAAETEIANLAMLIRRDGVEEFEAVVNDLAGDLPDEFIFAIGGPWPPHNFVQLAL